MGDLIELIKKGDYNFYDPIWEKISPEAKDIVSKMLQVDPAKRITPEKALQHEWLTLRRRNSVGTGTSNEKTVLTPKDPNKFVHKFPKQIRGKERGAMYFSMQMPVHGSISMDKFGEPDSPLKVIESKKNPLLQDFELDPDFFK